ncbi:Yqey-like protein [Glomus cerebriforme]|uniref:Altered inheritance of mitochondria protein 41 n=1 Tax=Glomus cerebriforme TaxID=658196 RepID=A0A397TE05_9GLOM|nr:Yqey-like protein [Glomus cerebriforme]
MPVIYATCTFTTTSISEEPSLFIKLKSEVKDAMRKKDQLRLNVVRGILSDITYASKSSSQTTIDARPTDQEIYTMINRAIKRRQESISQFSQAGRKDLVENEQNELNILVSYLPEQMSEKEIEIEIKKVVKKLDIIGEGSKYLGRVMKEIKIDSSKAPKRLVADIVKKVLSDINKKE